MSKKVQTQINALISALEENEVSMEDTSDLAGLFFQESLNDQEIADLNGATTTFDTTMSQALESLVEVGVTFEPDELQLEVGAAMQALASNPMAALESEILTPISEGANHIIKSDVPGGLTRRDIALEHYDDRDMGNLASRSIAYNMVSVRPSAFVRTIFPFVVFNPASAGVRTVVERMFRQDDVKRSVSGELTAFNRVDLTHAAIDSSILRDDSTRVIPVHRAQSAGSMVDTAVIPNWSIVNEGSPVNTNFIKFGEKVDMIGMSQTDTLLSKGVMDRSDNLDTRNSVDMVAYQVGADILEFKVSPIASAAFSSAHPGPMTTQTLNLSSRSLKLDSSSTARAGTAFTEAALTAIGTNNWTVQIEINCSGTLDIDTGETVVYAAAFTVEKIYDGSGVELDLADPTVAPTVTAINDAVALGWYPVSYRSNKNRRQRGRIIGTSSHVEEYYVPMRSPLSTLRHVGANKENKDIAVLVSATHVEMANDAVASLEDTADTLRQFTTTSNVSLDRPDYLGIGRFYVNPRFIERNVDLPLQINSITSHDRLDDIRAVLTMQIRDIASRLYLESGFSAGQAVLHPEGTAKPLVIIATDDYTASHLSESGGQRLLGDVFDHVVVTNINKDMRGKIYILLSDQNAVEGINPLGAGNTLYAPEMVSNLVIDRGGSTSKEVTVMRHWRMIMNNNVMGLIHVTGLDEVLGQVFHPESNTGGVNPASDPYVGLIPNGAGATGQWW